MPEAGAKELPALGARTVLVAAFGTYRRRFGLIAGAALVVFGISAGLDVLIDVVDDRASEYPGLVATLLVIAGLATFGTTFFAGLLDRIVGEEERGHPRRPLGQVLRTLPYWRLLAADVLLSLGAVFATIVLIIPGLVFYNGSIAPGVFRGQDVTVGDVYEAIGAYAAGHMTAEELHERPHTCRTAVA